MSTSNQSVAGDSQTLVGDLEQSLQLSTNKRHGTPPPQMKPGSSAQALPLSVPRGRPIHRSQSAPSGGRSKRVRKPSERQKALDELRREREKRSENARRS
ncbi:uncharacterized protein STEHIDRAFT_163040 [Stereum hirsutum FP-91666 SS1]|uniref:Uncharacterized protein n=1 Tax=Stereum hirsutum (strain FP-91666) TaxID=721885 RepID=R7RXN0_STEHR|nr:uncharacterized protein STEHIDRAFT_163040 [Stereum hirsutum FP-91666 SS1]EIM80166.1 hypothetical protein STEHIDRAFT_163040 [Stereum hirsutum FP-91666 SS1]